MYASNDDSVRLKKDAPAGSITLPGRSKIRLQTCSLGSRNPLIDTVGAAPTVPTSSAPSNMEGDPAEGRIEACRPGRKEGSLAYRC